MAFNVASISPFVNETAQELVTKAVATGKTIDRVSLIPGVKYKETLNIMGSDLQVQAAACGWTTSGSVSFLQREVEVYDLEVKETLCEKTLEKYWMGTKFKPGAPKEDQLGVVLADLYVNKVKEYNELNIWKGRQSGSIYGKIDGFIKVIGDEATRIHPSAATASITPSSIITIVDTLVANIPEAILEKEDLTLFMSNANYMIYTSALRTASLYNYLADNGNFETFVPGTNVKVVGTAGLTGVSNMVLTSASNLVVATDLVNENEKFDIWYSKDNDEVRVLISWKLGTQVYFPEFCVTNF